MAKTYTGWNSMRVAGKWATAAFFPMAGLTIALATIDGVGAAGLFPFVFLDFIIPLNGVVFLSMVPETREKLEGQLSRFSRATDKLADDQRASVQKKKEACEQILEGEATISTLQRKLKACESYARTKVAGSLPWRRSMAESIGY